MRLQRFDNQVILEFQLKVWDNQIVWYELIKSREGLLDGERIDTLAHYDSKKEAEDALREWERNPQAIKDTLVKVLV